MAYALLRAASRLFATSGGEPVKQRGQPGIPTSQDEARTSAHATGFNFIHVRNFPTASEGVDVLNQASLRGLRPGSLW